jgi:hypothetical protein
MVASLKRTTIKIIVTVFVLVLLCGISNCSFVNGETGAVTVGVKPGDWVKYEVSRIGESNEAWIYPDAVWINVTVLNVSGTTVQIREIIHYDDGEESTVDFSGDLKKGYVFHFAYIIQTNLKPGDKVYDSSVYNNKTDSWVPVQLTLNNTAQEDFGGVTRELNQLKWSLIEYTYPGTATHTRWWVNSTVMYRWDKETGFLVEYELQKRDLGFEEYYETHSPSTFKLEIVDTNLWQMKKPQSFWWMLITIPVGTVAIGVGVFVVRSKKVFSKK